MKPASPRNWALFAVAALPAAAAEAPKYTPLGSPGAANLSTAAQVFNAVHSAMRQWGSSLNHNGMSFIPVTVPAGEVFYHGSWYPGRPSDFEWLAFEIEHAAIFAHSSDPVEPSSVAVADGALAMDGPWSLHGSVDAISRHERSAHSASEEPARQHPLVEPTRPGDGDEPPRRPSRPAHRGYMQMYRASRDLNLVLIDGMSAAKCPLGTLDSTDYVLLDWPLDHNKPGFQDPMRREYERAKELCALGKEWDVDGWIRMEAGFEIIYCDFSEQGGLHLVSSHGSSFRNETGLSDGDVPRRGSAMNMFEWVRGAAARYHGLQLGRADIDFSGMVSIFSYPINMSNPYPERQDLPRLVNSTSEDRSTIRGRLAEVVASRKGRAWSSIKWQTIVDNLVTRYSNRISILASDTLPAAKLQSELATLLEPFRNYPGESNLPASQLGEAIIRCRDHYLHPALARKARWTREDEALHKAVETISETICTSLFTMRDKLEFAEQTSAAQAASQVRELAKNMMTELGWTTWKECGRCGSAEEICFVAMFPFGSVEDHWSPRCREDPDTSHGYWVFG